MLLPVLKLSLTRKLLVPMAVALTTELTFHHFTRERAFPSIKTKILPSVERFHYILTRSVKCQLKICFILIEEHDPDSYSCQEDIMCALELLIGLRLQHFWLDCVGLLLAT